MAIGGLVSEHRSGPEDQMIQFLGLGQGLGLGTQLQEWGEAQGWSKGQNVECKHTSLSSKAMLLPLKGWLCFILQLADLHSSLVTGQIAGSVGGSGRGPCALPACSCALLVHLLFVTPACSLFFQI